MLNNLGEVAELDSDIPSAIALFVHAERIFHLLHSRHARIPTESLECLATQMEPQRWAELRARAEAITWEEAVAAIA
jgi:hypothetical protein